MLIMCITDNNIIIVRSRTIRLMAKCDMLSWHYESAANQHTNTSDKSANCHVMTCSSFRYFPYLGATFVIQIELWVLDPLSRSIIYHLIVSNKILINPTSILIAVD